MKLLFLSSIITVPNDKGEKRIKKVLSKSEEGDFTLSKEWYTEQGLKPPLDAEEEINEDGTLLLKEDEFKYDFVDCIVRLEDFSSCIDNEKMGSVLYLRDGSELWVNESSEEIFGYITIITRPWYIILIDNIRLKFTIKK